MYSFNSFNQEAIGIDSLIIRRQFAVIMFVLVITNSFIDCPELLVRIGFRTI